MFALVYVSRALQPFTETDLRELADQAAQKNQRLDVTGYLNYKGGVFFQYLEGEEDIVLELLTAISRDERHRIAATIHLGSLQERLFPDWQMRYVSAAQMNSVRLEDVLERVLLTMTQPAFDVAAARSTTLQLVTKLADVRTRLSLSA